MQKITLVAVGIFLVVVGAFWLWSTSNGAAPVPQTAATSNTSSPQADLSTSTPASSGQGTTTTMQNITTATLHTTMGDITIQFLGAQAPNTVANFIKLAQSGFYNGTKFHRVIKGFMDQGGDPLTKDDSMQAQWGTGGPGYTFADENVNGQNNLGAVAMANSGPNTNGSQFYINAANNNFLDGKYSVFAEVTAGMSVVMAINNTPTDASDRPLTPVVLQSVTLK